MKVVEAGPVLSHLLMVVVVLVKQYLVMVGVINYGV